MKYRKNPVEVQAVQFTIKNYEGWRSQQSDEDFIDNCVSREYKGEMDEFYHQVLKTGDGEYRIETVVSDSMLSNGDFIIKNKEGLFYRLSDKVFHHNYEEVK